jgi:hypothetical protein
VSASGTPLNTTTASRADPNTMNSRPKIITKDIGTTTQAFTGGDQLLEGAAVADPVTGWHLDLGLDAPRSSATKLPRSRPRTLAVTTTRRLPFSRLIWFGPGDVDACQFAQRHHAWSVRWPSSPGARLRRNFRASPGKRDRQVGQSRRVAAQCLGQAHHDVESPIAVEQLACVSPPTAIGDRLLHRVLVESVADQAFGVGRDRQQRQARGAARGSHRRHRRLRAMDSMRLAHFHAASSRSSP